MIFTCERIRLSFVFFFFLLLHFFMFFSLFFVFSCFFNDFYYKNTMDECRHKILVVLVFTMAVHQVIAQVVSLQWVTITQHWSMMNLLLFFSKFVEMPPRRRNIWKYEREVGSRFVWRSRKYYPTQLLGWFFTQNTI